MFANGPNKQTVYEQFANSHCLRTPLVTAFTNEHKRTADDFHIRYLRDGVINPNLDTAGARRGRARPRCAARLCQRLRAGVVILWVNNCAAKVLACEGLVEVFYTSLLVNV